METYRRQETILHPVSFRERHVKTEELVYPVDVDFTSLDDARYREHVDVWVKRSADGLPSLVELQYPWSMDATQIVIIRYTRLA